jgi:hypothetical protein
MATSGTQGGVGGTLASRVDAALLALVAGGVVGGFAAAKGAITGLAVLGGVLGAAVLLGGLLAIPMLLY